MRIALVAPLVSPIADPPEGGSQAVVADLARGLSERGHDVVLYASGGSEVEGVSIRTLDIDSATLRGDTYRHGMQTPPSPEMIDAYRRIYTDIRATRWDAVHNHGFDAPAILEATHADLSVLHTLHLPPTVGMVAAIAEARDRITTTWCAAVSQSHALSWGAFTVIDGVLPNGVPIRRIPFGPISGRRAVIAARFSLEKGLAEGIAAARHAGWPVDVFAGPYNSEYESAVVRRWRTDEQVTFHGPVSRDRLWEEFSTAGVVLCLSRWDEPYGMVAAEAQAAGAPVIATRRGGLVEIINDGLTGYLVAPDGTEAATAAIAQVSQIDRAACRRRAEEHLSLDRALEAHEALYDRFRAAVGALAGSAL